MADWTNKQFQRIVVPRLKKKLTLKKVKGQGHGMVPKKELVTRIMHAKYQYSIINTSEDMSQVKVFVTDGQREGRTDKWVLMSPALIKGRGQQKKIIFQFNGWKACCKTWYKCFISNSFFYKKISNCFFFLQKDNLFSSSKFETKKAIIYSAIPL